MNEFLDNLRRQAEDQPMVAMGIGAAAITAIAKLLNAQTEHRNAKTWKKEVDRRTMKTQSKK